LVEGFPQQEIGIVPEQSGAAIRSMPRHTRTPYRSPVSSAWKPADRSGSSWSAPVDWLVQSSWPWAQYEEYLLKGCKYSFVGGGKVLLKSRLRDGEPRLGRPVEAL
jgi:hypothetical protein